MKKRALILLISAIAGIAFISVSRVSAAEKARVLAMNCSFSAQGYVAVALRFFANEVNLRSHGRLKIELYFNSSLGFKNTAILSSMKKGLVDLSSMMGGNIDPELPMAGVLNLPFLHPDYEKGIKWQLERLTPELSREASRRWNVTLLCGLPLPAPTEFFSKKPFRTLADLQGVKIRSWGGMLGESLYYLGANPFTITTAELYTALQRGMVNAAITSVISATETHFWEVLDYIDHITMSTNQCSVGISNRVLKSLPQDLQEVMFASGKALTEWGLVNRKIYADKLLKILTDNGMEEVWPEPGEVEKMRAKTKPLYDKFIKELSPESLPLLEELGVY